MSNKPDRGAPILSPEERACIAIAEAFAHDEPAAGRRALLVVALRAAHDALHADHDRRLVSEEHLDHFLIECLRRDRPPGD